MARRVVFLDRDGTINLDRGYVHRIEDWEFLPGSVEAISRLRAAGYAVAVVSNQSGVGAGKYNDADLDRLHTFFLSELARQGAAIDAYAYCPHTAQDACPCRKPRTGMAQLIEHQLGEPIDHSASWTIGDKVSDMGFGHALGTRTILLRSRYWSDAEAKSASDYIADSLLCAAELILAERDCL